VATKEEKAQRKQRRREWRKAAHPFFWLLWLLLLPAIAAAAFAPNEAPGYALHSAWLYRLEVGGAFYFGLFILALLLWLGYTGRSVRNLQLPGGAGAGVPQPNADFDEAATGLQAYAAQTNMRLKKIEDTIRVLATDDDKLPDDDVAAEDDSGGSESDEGGEEARGERADGE
jgi:hypothetical protein